jgi:hypothetical protein
MSEFFFGQAQAVITPPIGTELVGYPERDHGCEGVHDDLFAKAWVFSDGNEHAALAFLDLTGVDLEFTGKVREIVAANTPIKPHAVHLNFTHTHSGPACLPGAKNPIERMYNTDDPELNAMMVRYVSGVIISAFLSLRKGRVGFGRGELHGLATNRRDPGDPMDNDVDVFRLEEEDGRLAGAIVKYSCHPTVLNEENYLVSRDYPGFMCDALQAAKGGGIQVAFAQGTGADASTRYTRRSKTFIEAERLGHMLAGAALSVLERIETGDDIQVRCQKDEVELPTLRLPVPEDADKMLAEATRNLESLKTSDAPEAQVRSAYVAELGAKVQAQMARLDIPPVLKAEVGLLSLGRWKIALLPGEMMAVTGKKLQDSLGEGSVVFGYTNSSHGYFLPAEQEAKGGYETGVSLVTSQAEAIIREAVVRLSERQS